LTATDQGVVTSGRPKTLYDVVHICVVGRQFESQYEFVFHSLVTPEQVRYDSPQQFAGGLSSSDVSRAPSLTV
jgi:hypothetical protein